MFVMFNILMQSGNITATNNITIAYFLNGFSLIVIPTGIIIALISQYKQKSLFGLIIGIIPCIHYIISPFILGPIQMLIYRLSW
jgi:hypothetical protein